LGAAGVGPVEAGPVVEVVEGGVLVEGVVVDGAVGGVVVDVVVDGAVGGVVVDVSPLRPQRAPVDRFTPPR
jgi:hypothetical protein